DTYFKPDIQEDAAMLRELSKQYPEEGAIMEKLMPAWSREGYERGIKEGIEQGMEQGMEQGLERGLERGKEQGLENAALNMLREGMDIYLIAKVTGYYEEKIESLNKQLH